MEASQSQSDEKFFELKIDSSSVRIFSAALHLCQKVGRDVILEVEDHAMTLRSLNDNKSAYISIEFSSDYFDNYNLSSDTAFACKLSVKPICMIMRNLKPVKSIIVTASRINSVHELAFRLTQFNGITRCTRFYYSDCEVMNAVFYDDECSYIRMVPKLLAHVLQNMHRSPEVSFQASPTSIMIKSHFLPEVWLQDYRVIMNTGMTISTNEFEVYDYRSESTKEELVFCVKEVNAFLAFCEALEMPSFDFFFSCGGRAIKLNSKQDLVTVSLIMASIQPPGVPGHTEDVPPTEVRYPTQTKSKELNRPRSQRKSPSPEPQTYYEEYEPEVLPAPTQTTDKSLTNSQNVLEASLVLGSIRQIRTDDIHLTSTTNSTSIDIRDSHNSDEETVDERTLHRQDYESDPEFQDDGKLTSNTKSTMSIMPKPTTNEVNLTCASNEQPKPVSRHIGNRRKRSFLEDSDTEED